MGILDVLRPRAKRTDSSTRIDNLQRSEQHQVNLDDSTFEYNRAIAAALQQLVALKLYELGMPLSHVKAADTSGVVAAAIEALAAERFAEDVVAGVSQQVTAAGDQVGVLAEPDSTWQDDVVFFDRVRRAATEMGIPFDEGTNLEKLADQNGWTREHMGDIVEGLGLDR